VTEFDVIFAGYQPSQVSVLNQCFEDHLGHHHHQGLYIQNCGVTCCFAWVWNLVSHMKGRTKIEGLDLKGRSDLCSPLRVGDQVSHPCKTIGNTTVLYICRPWWRCRDGLWNVGSIRTPDAADSPRRLHEISAVYIVTGGLPLDKSIVWTKRYTIFQRQSLSPTW